MFNATFNDSNGAAAVAVFLVGYLFLVFCFAAVLGLGWGLEPTSHGAWPHPQRYGRLFSLAFLGLLSALGGFPPFFLLAPKLALFSWLVSLGAWGSLGLMCSILIVGWYVYWQAASGLFDPSNVNVRPSKRLSKGGALLLGLALFAPLALSGCLLDLWAVAQWLVG